MGLSSKKTTTTQTNKPIYSGRVEGASDMLSNAYQAQRGKISGVADNFLGLSNELLDRYREGDPAINAARDYITTTLGSDPQNNPYLDQMVSNSTGDVRNQMQAALGARGLTGGSDYANLISKNVADKSLAMRYQDYDQQMARQAQAAGMAPGIAAGDYMTLAPALQTGEMGAMLPLQAALANAAGQGGLLGQYQSTTGTQKQSGGMLGGLLGSALSGWASGGFSGI